jgi:hypothetical protein
MTEQLPLAQTCPLGGASELRTMAIKIFNVVNLKHDLANLKHDLAAKRHY